MFEQKIITDEWYLKKFKASKLKDGRWFARIPLAYDSETKKYKYKAIYGVNEREVEKKLLYFIRDEIERRKKAEETAELFTTIFEKWLYSYKSNKVKETTFDRYEQTYLYQIKPHLIGVKLTDVTSEKLQEILDTAFNIGYSHSSILKVYRLLLNFYKHITKRKVIATNPMPCVEMYTRAEVDNKQSKLRDIREAAQAKKEKHMPLSQTEEMLLSSQLAMEDKKEISFFSDDEIARIKDAIQNGYTRFGHSRSGKLCEYHFSATQGEVFLLMLNTGLRRGEMLALQYRDVDWDNKTIGIVKNIVSVSNRDENNQRMGGRKTKQGTPKTTRSYQTYLSVNDTAIALLKQLKSKEPAGYDGYIIHNGDKPLSPGAFAKRLRNLLSGIGIEGKGLHTLRHTFASKLYEQTGGDTKLVSELLRHESVAFTAEIYIHLESKYKKTVLNNFSV